MLVLSLCTSVSACTVACTVVCVCECENMVHVKICKVLINLSADTSDLFFDIREDGLGGCGLSEQGFARLWATTRGSSGVKGGRYYYEVRIEENVSVELPETEEHPHAIRYMHARNDPLCVM